MKRPHLRRGVPRMVVPPSHPLAGHPDVDVNEPLVATNDAPPEVDEETVRAALAGAKVEQSWIPPAILCDGVLLVNLPRGVYLELKPSQVMALLQERLALGVDILQPEDACRVLGVKQ